MIGAILSLIITAVSLVLFTVIMLFTGYIKYTSYANAFLINLAWFFVGKFGGDFIHVWYPNFCDTAGKNFWAVTLFMLIAVLVINRFPKIRVCYYISSSIAVGMLISIIALLFSESEPTTGYAIFLAVFAFVTIILQLGAVESRGIDDSGNILSRIIASVMLTPAPFLVSLIVIDVIWKMESLQTEIMYAAAVAALVAIGYFIFDTIHDREETYVSDIDISKYNLRTYLPNGEIVIPSLQAEPLQNEKN